MKAEERITLEVIVVVGLVLMEYALGLDAPWYFYLGQSAVIVGIANLITGGDRAGS